MDTGRAIEGDAGETHACGSAGLSRDIPLKPCREELRDAMAFTEKTRSEVAHDIGVTPDYLSRVLNGSRPCPPELARQILLACRWPTEIRIPPSISPQLRLFIAAFATEAPLTLEARLGELSHLIEPRWAVGMIHRMAELLCEVTKRKQRKLEDLYDIDP